MKVWTSIILAAAAGLSGCDKTPVAAPPPASSPTEYDYVFEKPYFMEHKPQAENIGPLRWIWYAEDRMLNLTHIINHQSAELFESPEALKTAVANEVGLKLTSEFTRETLERLAYQHEDDKGLVYAVAEKTPDGRVTVALFGIFPAVPKELRTMKSVESIVKALNAGGFEERREDWPPS